MYLSFKLPGKIMFAHLDVMCLYPIYNATLSCLSVVIISGIKDKNINRIRVAIVGMCSLIISIIVLYTHNNSQVLMYIYQHITELLPFTLIILSEISNVLFTTQPGPSSGSIPADEPSSSKQTGGGGSNKAPVPSKDLTDVQLDDMFGKPDKEKLAIIQNKIRTQAVELNESAGKSKVGSIYRNYSPKATLTLDEYPVIARHLLGLHEGYAMQYNKDAKLSKVMRIQGNHYCLVDNSGRVLSDVKRGL